MLILTVSGICQVMAQADTSYADTVIVVKDPHIIRKRVVLGNGNGGMEFSKLRNSVWSVYADAGLSKWAQTLPECGHNVHWGTTFEANAGAVLHLKQLQISLGLCLLRPSLHYADYSEEAATRQKTITVYDYSNASTEILAGRLFLKV